MWNCSRRLVAIETANVSIFIGGEPQIYLSTLDESKKFNKRNKTKAKSQREWQGANEKLNFYIDFYLLFHIFREDKLNLIYFRLVPALNLFMFCIFNAY